MMLDRPSQSIGLKILHPRTDEKISSNVALRPSVEQLLMAETLLTEVQHQAPSCPGKRLLKWCTQKKNVSITLLCIRVHENLILGCSSHSLKQHWVL
jgi:hypothetical protein